MNEEQQTLAQIRKELNEMEPEDRARIEAIAATFRNAVIAGRPYSYMAIGLVGAEVAAEAL